MSGIERLYAFTERRTGGSPVLDSVVGQAGLGWLREELHAYFAALQNEASRTGRSPTKAWRHAVQFVSGICEFLVKSERHEDVREFAAAMKRLSHHLGGRRRRVQRPRGLPAGVVEDLYELTNPDSPRNPFRTEAHRWRNFVVFMLLLHVGLRRGELLCQALDAICEETDPRSGLQRFWINVQENPYGDIDPRSDPPRLKNELAVRQVPVSSEIARIVETYVQNFRGRRKQAYLVYAQSSRPLAARSLGRMFQVLSRKLSPAARRELWNRRRPIRVTPHDLRHTCAAVRVHQLVGDDDSRLPMVLQQLRPFFGWEKDSEMPLLYARTYFEHRLASVWRADFDARVDVLRRLE